MLNVALYCLLANVKPTASGVRSNEGPMHHLLFGGVFFFVGGGANTTHHLVMIRLDDQIK